MHSDRGDENRDFVDVSRESERSPLMLLNSTHKCKSQKFLCMRLIYGSEVKFTDLDLLKNAYSGFSSSLDGLHLEMCETVQIIIRFLCNRES